MRFLMYFIYRQDQIELIRRPFLIKSDVAPKFLKIIVWNLIIWTKTGWVVNDKNTLSVAITYYDSIMAGIIPQAKDLVDYDRIFLI